MKKINRIAKNHIKEAQHKDFSELWSDVDYHVEMIEMSLGEIQRGKLSSVYNIDSHVKALKEIAQQKREVPKRTVFEVPT
jgi:hypothetical protein